MILIILGAHNSTPKTHCSIMVFLKLTYGPKRRTFNSHAFYKEFTSPFYKNHTRKNNEKTKKIQTPPQVTENRPSSKNRGICNVFAS